MVQKRTALMFLLMVTVMVVGCSSAPRSPAASDSTSQTDPAATAPAESTAEDSSLPDFDVYPADYRTQIPEVDAVIDAFLAQDVDGLASCSMVKCEEDAEGNLKPQVYYGSCQVNSLADTWDSVRAALGSWVGAESGRTRTLYAAYRVRDDSQWGYFLQFAEDRNDERAKAAVLDKEGKIIQVWFGCGAPQSQWGEDFEPIAPPRVNP